MRKLLIFAVGMVLLVGGLWVLIQQLFFSPVIHFIAVASAGFFGFIGAYLLWEDFVAPRLADRSSERSDG